MFAVSGKMTETFVASGTGYRLGTFDVNSHMDPQAMSGRQSLSTCMTNEILFFLMNSSDMVVQIIPRNETFATGVKKAIIITYVEMYYVNMFLKIILVRQHFSTYRAFD